MTHVPYEDKDVAYFTHTRRDIIAMFPTGFTGKVLEIGCGHGHTLLELKKRGIATEIVGVELTELQRTSAEIDAFNRYIVGDIETGQIELPKGHFDAVICGDVLEHLNDPWSVVCQLQELLKPNGLLISSVPNVREARTLYNVFVRGDFAYMDEGVLDRTHLRFFCKKNALQLLTVAGGTIEQVSSDLASRTNWRARLNRLTFGLLEQFLVTQYLFVVRKG